MFAAIETYWKDVAEVKSLLNSMKEILIIPLV